MTKEEAKKEAKRLFSECNEEMEKLTKKAKEDGTFRSGLDANNALYEAIMEKYKKKLAELEASIDE